MEDRTLLSINSTLPIRELLDGFEAGVDYAAKEVLIQLNDCQDEPVLGSTRNKLGNVLERLDSGGATECSGGALQVVSLASGVSVAEAIRSLRRDPAVRYAEPNWIYTRDISPNDPYYTSGQLWGMYGDATTPTNKFGSQAGELWAAGYTGSSTVYVGVIDEGLQDTHPDLDANVWTNQFDPVDGIDNDQNGYTDDIHGWDFVNNDATVYDGGTTGSLDKHGTHVAGTIGAEGNNSTGVVGVNWNVKMISAKFLGAGGGTTANAIKSVDYITDLKVRHGLNIVATNNSWGGGGFSQGLLDAITRAAQQNILFIAAAGNSGLNNDTSASYPSNYNTTSGAGYDSVIAVAAIASNGTLASFSNYGATTVDLGAPGVAIYSTLPFNTYGAYSGTSMASPHVAGAAAVYASTHPGSSALTIRNAILNAAAATSTPSLIGKTVTGGRLNVSNFVADLLIDDITKAEGTGIDPTVYSFTVRLSAPSLETVQVNVATSDGSATAGSDYTAIATTTLQILPGSTTKTIAVDVGADSESEAHETFLVNLNSASNARIVTSRAMGTILNDDGELTIDDFALAEGTGSLPTPFAFTVSLKHPTILPVAVDYSTADDTAQAPADYTARPATTINLAPGETSKTITVDVSPDDVGEPDESFFVNLAPAHAALDQSFDGLPPGAQNGGVGYIANGQTFTVGTAGMLDSFIVNVSTRTGNAIADVRRTTSSGVPIFDDNAALASFTLPDTGGVYTDINVNVSAAAITVATGDVLAIVIHEDVNGTGFAWSAKYDADATYAGGAVYLRYFSNPWILDATTDFDFQTFVKPSTNATIVRDRGVGTIINDDASISIEDVTLAEGSDGGITAFEFTVSLGQPSISVVTVDVETVDGSATAGSDYIAIPATTLVFAPGETSQVVSVSASADSASEAHDTFFVALSNPTNAGLARDQATGTIQNDDGELIISDVSLTEGTGSSATPFVFTVSLKHPTILPVTVDYVTADDSALAPDDYTAIPATTISLAPGETSQQVSVDVVADSTTEPDETFFVQLTNATGAVITTDRGVGSILDDDEVFVPAEISIGDVTRAEGTGTSPTTFSVTVSLVEPNNQTVTVELVTTDGTATAGSDYTTIPTTVLTFAPGETAQSVDIVITADSTSEPFETIKVKLSNPTNGVLADDTAIVTIQNDDGELTITDVSNTEGTSSTRTPYIFVVALTHPSVLAVSVDAETADGTALAGSDYVAMNSTTLMFQPGETSQTVQVDVEADSIGEPNETFLVRLSNATNAILAKDQGTGTILNDDATISIDDVTKEEGTGVKTTFVFTVTLSIASTARITVDYFTQNDTAVSPSDYLAKTTTTLVFNPGETSKTISITVNGDKRWEADETFFVRLTNAINATFTDDTGVGTILNDDVLPPDTD
jgi:subtilisin family serine protease